MLLKGRIIVYSITGCHFCMKAKHILQELELPFTAVNFDKFPQCRAYVKERTGSNSVPQIFFNNHHIGGIDDLQKLVRFVCNYG